MTARRLTNLQQFAQYARNDLSRWRELTKTRLEHCIFGWGVIESIYRPENNPSLIQFDVLFDSTNAVRTFYTELVAIGDFTNSNMSTELMEKVQAEARRVPPEEETDISRFTTLQKFALYAGRDTSRWQEASGLRIDHALYGSGIVQSVYESSQTWLYESSKIWVVVQFDSANTVEEFLTEEFWTTEFTNLQVPAELMDKVQTDVKGILLERERANAEYLAQQKQFQEQQATRRKLFIPMSKDMNASNALSTDKIDEHMRKMEEHQTRYQEYLEDIENALRSEEDEWYYNDEDEYGLSID